MLNFLFIGIGVLLVSMIAVNQEIVDKQNYFPVFLFLLLSIVGVSPFQITSQVFTNVFVLFSIYKLLDIYRKDEVLKQIFEASFWLSVSAFITISSIISFPLFFVCLLILRPFHWREWAIALIGFFFHFLCTSAWLTSAILINGTFFEATTLYFKSMKVPSFSEYYLPVSLSLFVLVFISILYNLFNGFGNTVKQRTKSILLWFLFFSTLVFQAEPTVQASYLLMLFHCRFLLVIFYTT